METVAPGAGDVLRIVGGVVSAAWAKGRNANVTKKARTKRGATLLIMVNGGFVADWQGFVEYNRWAN